ncbi:Histone-lysine N-methyltransferase 2C [Plecturocebus cupreus]
MRRASPVSGSGGARGAGEGPRVGERAGAVEAAVCGRDGGELERMSSEEDKSVEQPQPPPPPPEEPGAPAPSPAAADKRPRGRPRKDGASPFQRARKKTALPGSESTTPVESHSFGERPA